MGNPTIRVRNILGVERADLELNGIALVTGTNGQGKSSLLQAVAALLAGDWHIRHADKKAALETVVREGEAQGLVQIKDDRGAAKLSLPDGTVTTDGLFDFHPAVAVGATSLMALGEKERLRELLRWIKADPTKDDLVKALQDSIAQENIDTLWIRIEKDGWDVTLRNARDHGTRKKGEWEGVTGVNFGTKKVQDWHPDSIDPLDALSLEDYEKAVQEADRAHQAASKKHVLSGAEMASLREQVAGLPQMRAELAKLDDDLEAANARLAEAVEYRNSLPDAVDVRFLPKCPHCEKPIQLTRDGPVVKMERPPVEKAADPNTLKDRQLAIAGADGTVKNKEHAVSALISEKTKLAGKIHDASKAEERLAKNSETTEEDASLVEQTRADLDSAKARLSDFKRWQRAKKIAEQIGNNGAICEVLKPEGLRKTKLSESIGDFNLILSELSAVMGMDPVVSMRESGIAYWGGRPYERLSESEKFRVDVVLQIALAQITETPIVCIDRLDVLIPSLRPKLLKTIKHAGLSAVVAMTAKDAESVPALGGKAQLGRSYWIEGGNLEEIG